MVAGSGGARDLLISYGDGDTIRIVGWSNLSVAQQELWEFVSVAPAISSQHSADTPDISVLPETQGGTAPIVINGTSSADNLQGTDLGEAINGQAGNDTIAGDGGDDWSRIQKILSVKDAPEREVSLPLPTRSLSVKGLAATPQGPKAPVISGVQFELAAGDGLGVLGPSGSGKSSLARALVGVWPSLAGDVRFDGAVLSHYKQAQLGEMIG